MQFLTLVMMLLLSTFAPVAGQSPAAGETPLLLWRLDCGSLNVDLSEFSDTGLYDGERRTLTVSCYLIRNGDQFLLWDTGLSGQLAGKPRDSDGSLLSERIVTQLARIGVERGAVTFVGISHYHYDHTGQAADFPQAKLLIGKSDLDVVRSHDGLRERFAPWLAGSADVQEVEGDHDIFGDGRVVMVDLPGHTPGHHGLFIKLVSGPVLLSGDQYHFTDQVANRGVPLFNHDRADTLASHDRLDRLAANLYAKVVIQHEPGDIDKLPVFPKPAK